MVDHIEVAANAKYTKAHAALGVNLGCIAAALQLEESSPEIACLSKVVGKYILSSCQCLQQTWHNDVERRETRSLGYFTLVTGEEDTSAWDFLGSHLYVDSNADKKMTLAKYIKMEGCVIKKK